MSYNDETRDAVVEIALSKKDQTIAALTEESKKERCEHCGSDKIYHGPPDCPLCGAPNCCQVCCKITRLEKEIESLTGERDHLQKLYGIDHHWRVKAEEILRAMDHSPALLTHPELDGYCAYCVANKRLKDVLL